PFARKIPLPDRRAPFMTHGHAHEEAEHAEHHAADPFARRVAMSMVAIAAVLAAVKVLGHRTHNETLAYEIKAGVTHTQESDQWNFFQAKKMREVLARQEARLLEQTTPIGQVADDSSANRRLPGRDKRLKEMITELSKENVEDHEKAAKKII